MSPSSAHVINFETMPGRISCIPPTRCTLKMIESCVRRPHNPVPSLAYSQTVVDIIEIHRKVLRVKSPQLKEDVLSRRHTSAGHRRKVLDQNRAAKVPRVHHREPVMRVSRHPSQAEQYTAMLQTTVGVIQGRANNRHFRTTYVPHHFL